ncbi:hypothetical protein D3C75_965970 [compost metagenome]
MERFVNDARQILNIPYQIAMFRYRHGYACDIRFLESVCSNQAGEDIPGNNHEGNRVHKSCSDSGNKIGCSGTGGCDANSRFAACSGITVSSVNRALLMTGQNMFEIIEPVKRIVNIQHRSARVSEYSVHTFQNQTAQQDFGTCNYLRIFPFLT